MPAQPGQTLSHYRLIEKIGEGGMGVVWKAVDTTLDREVAIKVLPDALSQDAERLARFEREAKLLASLNHPNIATIHGLEQAEGLRFLVMELVEGEDLARRVQRGPIPMEEALPLAKQLADALEAAHEQGVVHRDLKPQNVKLTPDGKVKVLDFGLAKAFGPDTGDPTASPTMSPTATSAGSTALGVILGTAAYMSPEQAKGKLVDRRADIWAFGVVLQEMLTGRALFHGESVSETLAAVLMSEPDLASLPANTPPKVRRLIERCLRKDPQSRLRDIGDARVVIEEALAGHEWESVSEVDAGPAPPGLSLRTFLLPGLPLLATGVLIGAFLLGGPGRETTVAPGQPAYVTIVPDPEMEIVPAISPDGSKLVYRGEGSLWVRELASPEARPLPGTDNSPFFPVFSPDGSWIAYVSESQRRLFKLPVDGSSLPVELGEWKGGLVPCWLSGGQIVSNTQRPFRLVGLNADDGTPLPEIEITGEAPGNNAFLVLRALPGDGRYVLGAADSYGENGWQMNTVLVDTETGESSVLVERAAIASWSPTGHLVFSRNHDLLAAPFDLERREITGSAVALATGLLIPRWDVSGYFDLARNGTLVYATGPGRESDRLFIADTDGNAEPWSEEPRSYDDLRVSPDGRRVVANVVNLNEGLDELWISGLDRPRLRPLVDEAGTDCITPVWSPDNLRVAYACGDAQEWNVFVRKADSSGSPRTLWSTSSTSEYALALDFTPDGRSLLIRKSHESEADALLLLPASLGEDGEPAELLSPVNGFGHRFSPDGRCLTYVASPAGRREVYFRCFDTNREPGAEAPVSTAGGWDPRWRATTENGTSEIVFRNGSGFHAVRVRTQPTSGAGAAPRIELSDPVKLSFPEDLRAAEYDFLPDGRLLFVQPEERDQSDDWFHLVLNFSEELRTKVPR
jgi:serine/threonine-protein kinase